MKRSTTAESMTDDEQCLARGSSPSPQMVVETAVPHVEPANHSRYLKGPEAWITPPHIYKNIGGLPLLNLLSAATVLLVVTQR